MSFKIGKANLNKGGFTKKEWFKMKDGDNVYRILPPMFDFADRGKWSEFYRIEYGYTDNKKQLKPFLCNRVTNKKTKMVEVECPACLHREEINVQIEALKQQLVDKEISRGEFEAALAPLNGFNLDSKHYVNAIDLTGKIGLLKIGYKAKLQLDDEIDKLKDRGIDPLSIETGIFFNFYRTGFGRDTNYKVTVYMETIKHPELGIVQKELVHVLDDVILARLEKEAFDLSKLFKTLTNEQVQDIVDNGAGGVERVFGVSNAATEDAHVVDEKITKPAVVAPKVVKPVVQPVVQPIVEEVEEVEAEVEEAAEVVEPPKAAPKAAVKAKPIAAKQAAAKPAVAAQSDEDFLKSLGL
jgi:hypothetical protein